jgi:DNA-binding response OmpR family regulator
MSEPLHSKVLLVEDNPLDARLLREYLAAGGGALELRWADDLAKGLAMAAELPPDIAILDLTLPDSKGLDTFLRFHQAAPFLPVIVMTGLDDQDLAVEAVRRGAQDYLVKTEVRPPALIRAIRYAIERHRSAADSKRARPQRARTIAFVGAKGGVGTTTVAVNVASALARSGRSVVLIELRPYPGTLSRDLQIAPAGSTAEFADMDPGTITAHEVMSRLSRLPSGLRVLFGPRGYEQSHALEAAQLEAMIRALQGGADFLLFDLLPFPAVLARTAVVACNYAAIVAAMNPVSIAAAREVAELIESWGVSRHLIGAIGVHQAATENACRIADLASTTLCEVAGMVPPAADAVLAAYHAGSPLVAARPESNAAVALIDLAARLAEDRVVAL